MWIYGLNLAGPGYRQVADVFWGNRRERDHWGDLGVGSLIIFEWISRRWNVDIWTEFGWPRI